MSTLESLSLELNTLIMKHFSTLVLLFAATLALNSQKMVMMEKFTSPFCGSCAGATENLKTLVKEYPNVIWVNHHKPVTWIENPIMNEQSSQLWFDLNLFGTPLGMVNRQAVGTTPITGQGNWRGLIETELNKPEYVDVDITNISLNAEDGLIEFSVETEFLELAHTGPYRVNVMIVEDSIKGVRQHSYFNDVAGHPLEGKGEIIWNYTHSNGVRAILENRWGIADVIPDQPVLGEKYTRDFAYGLPDAYNVYHMRIVAFVSKYDDTDFRNLEVLNATREELKDYQLSNTENELKDYSVEVFPNPTQDLIQLKSDIIPSTIELIDIQGQLIKTIQPNREQSEMNVSELSEGAYYLIFRYEDGVVKKPFQKID